MESSESNFSDIDRLLKEIVEKDLMRFDFTLFEFFEERIKKLDMSFSNAAKIIGIENRALKGILLGTQKVLDFTNLMKIANFLQIPYLDLIARFVVELNKNFNSEILFPTQKIEFLVSNFDLVALKKVGFIESISDYKHIEERLNKFFGYNSIFEYSSSKTGVAFSSGIVTPKSELTRENWVETAKAIFREIDNPNEYDRAKLIEFFPEIRWYSKNVEFGLLDVIKILYKLGVTVIYLESLPSLHLRGATFSIGGRPCVVLTNYRGFYPTLWFALIHELFHVLFDWEEIISNKYHLSDQDSTQVSIIEKEKEADDFSRAYLFSIEKTNQIKKSIMNHQKVIEFADINDVHFSFIYVFLARDLGGQKGVHWARAHKYNPDINKIINKFKFSWVETKSVFDFAKFLKLNIFN